jgi:hypothetical protein
LRKNLNYCKTAFSGLKQAGRQWFLRNLRVFLRRIGLIQYNTDNCLFGKYKNNKLLLLPILYVDDILIAGENKETTKVVTKIKYKYKVSTDKTANKIIGVNFIKKKKKGYKKLIKKDYIEKMQTNYSLNNTKII